MNSSIRWNIEKIKDAGSVFYVCYKPVDSEHPRVISCFDTVECGSLKEARSRCRELNRAVYRDRLRTRMQALSV